MLTGTVMFSYSQNFYDELVKMMFTYIKDIDKMKRLKIDTQLTHYLDFILELAGCRLGQLYSLIGQDMS